MKRLGWVGAVVGVAMSVVAGMPAAHAGPNLAPNPGFEVPAVAAADPVLTAVNQPLLPDGWVFEGAAGLFDYADQRCLTAGLGFPCRPAHSGNRFAAISDPLSGPRQQCVGQIGQCVDLFPVNIAKDIAAQGYSVTPVWRTTVPVAVNPFQTYTFSSFVRWDLATAGAGPFLAVRWIDTFGLPIRVDRVAFDPSTPLTESTGWHQIFGFATAPSSAVGAVLMLGHSDDAWISQVRFDDVFFG